MKNLLAAGLLLAVVLVVFASQTVGRRWLSLIVFGIAALILALSFHFARAHDYGQWEATDPAIRHWYQTLMQPDNPGMSCCGEADAYWADEVHVRDGKLFATITDDRDDAPLGRPHIDNGTEIQVPSEKFNKSSNPTGHNIVFLSRSLYVLCFIGGPGI